MRYLLALLCVLLCALSTTSVFAQDITGYRIRYYAPGASAPMQQTDTFPAASVRCDQALPPPGTSVNPGTAYWDDPANAGRACMYTLPTGSALIAFPVGAYEATLTASNAAGESVESNRAPFSRAALPIAPKGFGLSR